MYTQYYTSAGCFGSIARHPGRHLLNHTIHAFPPTRMQSIVRGSRVDTSEIRVVRLGRQFPHTFNCIAWPVYNIVPNNLVHARVVMNHQSDDSTILPGRPENCTYSLTWHNALQSNYITLPATIPSTLLILTHGVATLYTNKQYVAATHVPFRPGRVTYFLISHSTPTSN